jgi:hypothetical protein
MYVWIWRNLPGNLLVRALLATMLFLAIVAILWYWAFPWAYVHLPLDSVGITP